MPGIVPPAWSISDAMDEDAAAAKKQLLERGAQMSAAERDELLKVLPEDDAAEIRQQLAGPGVKLVRYSDELLG